MTVFRRRQRPFTTLRSLKLFAGCTTSELNRISSLTMEVEVRQGTVLAEEGSPGREFFIITEGTATVSRGGLRLADLEAGSFFGETALLDGGCRTATVSADTDLTLFIFSPAEFRALQNIAPTVTHRMLTEMGRRLRVTDQLLEAESPRSSASTGRPVEASGSGTHEMVLP